MLLKNERVGLNCSSFSALRIIDLHAQSAKGKCMSVLHCIPYQGRKSESCAKKVKIHTLISNSRQQIKLRIVYTTGYESVNEMSPPIRARNWRLTAGSAKNKQNKHFPRIHVLLHNYFFSHISVGTNHLASRSSNLQKLINPLGAFSRCKFCSRKVGATICFQKNGHVLFSSAGLIIDANGQSGICIL